VATAASVLGRCGAALLRAVSGGDDGSVDECTGLGVLVAGSDSYGFRHELARRAVLHGLPAGERVGLHRRALDALRPDGDDHCADADADDDGDDDGPDPARVAWHAAEAGDAAAVLALGPVAARRAALLGAHREAAGHYATTLRFAGCLDVVERAVLLERHARECELTAAVGDAIASLEEALALWRQKGDEVRAGRAPARWPTCGGAGATGAGPTSWRRGRSSSSKRPAATPRSSLGPRPSGASW
jgi:hypothetical protein